MIRVLRLVHAAVAWLFVGAVLVQVFLAGLGMFGGSGGLALHVEFGYWVLGLLAIAMLLGAIAARAGWPAISGTFLLVVLYVVQTVLPDLGATSPALAALHPVNALLIFVLAIGLARRALTAARAPLEESSLGTAKALS